MRKPKGTPAIGRLLAINTTSVSPRAFPVRKGKISIGSEQSNDIVVEDASVSGHHAIVKTRRASSRISDLESTNGTFVNGRRVSNATQLARGDEIRIGKVSLVFAAPLPTSGSMAANGGRAGAISIRTVAEILLVAFVIGFGSAQYLAYMKYREENRLLVARAEPIPADQIAMRATPPAVPSPAAMVPVTATVASPAASMIPVASAVASPAASIVPGTPAVTSPASLPSSPLAAASPTTIRPTAAPQSRPHPPGTRERGSQVAELPAVRTKPAPSTERVAVSDANPELSVAVDLSRMFPESGRMAGRAAPFFDLQDLSGQTVSLDSFRGRVVLIDAWATWCHVCRSEMPKFVQLYQQFKSSPRLAIVTVSQDRDPGRVRWFLSQNRYDLPVLLDPTGAFGAAYQVNAVPSTYLISSTGEIIWNLAGAPDWSDSQLQAEIRKLL